MILCVGQVRSSFAERQAFQKVDIRRLFAPMAKWLAQSNRADRIPEMASHAFHTAVAGRPGPVVLAVREDVLASTATVADAGPLPHRAPLSGTGSALAALERLLAEADRPLVMLEGGGWPTQACADMAVFVENCGLPVCVSFCRQDWYDHRRPNDMGHRGIGMSPALARRIRGRRGAGRRGAPPGEGTTGGYTLITPPVPRERLVHVHAGAEALGASSRQSAW
jgi:acetolactate synthase-1/2/3 large subunit